MFRVEHQDAWDENLAELNVRIAELKHENLAVKISFDTAESGPHNIHTDTQPHRPPCPPGGRDCDGSGTASATRTIDGHTADFGSCLPRG